MKGTHGFCVFLSGFCLIKARVLLAIEKQIFWVFYESVDALGLGLFVNAKEGEDYIGTVVCEDNSIVFLGVKENDRQKSCGEKSGIVSETIEDLSSIDGAFESNEGVERLGFWWMQNDHRETKES